MAEILTGSILSEGSTTGGCIGDTDLVAAPYSTCNVYTNADESDVSPNKCLGTTGTIGHGDSCEAYCSAVEGNEDVKSVSDAHAYCTASHTGNHIH